MNAKPKGLGRGLGAIFELESTALPEQKPLTGMEEVEITLISPNPKQPRTRFSEDALEELADSIQTLGVIQPITVTHAEDGRYTIISGERRWRASQLAGLETIPVYIREVDDQSLHEMALVENIQREDLNAIEVALGLQRLIDECGLTQETLASRVGKKRSTVANYMRLLKLPAEVQLAVRDNLISMGHARAIASLSSEEDQFHALKRVLKKSLSVRQTEELVHKMAAGAPEKTAATDEEFPETYTRLVEQLERLFTQDISIKKTPRGGRITIGFHSDEDVECLLKKLEQIS